MGVLVHHSDCFKPLLRDVHKIARPMTVRRLVSRHKALRQHTSARRPGGVYGRRKVREFAKPHLCFLNGQVLRRDDWNRIVGEKDIVHFICMPPRPLGGGGGGGGGSNPIGLILAIAVMVAVPYLGPEVGLLLGFAEGSALGTAIGGALVGLVGSVISYGIMSLFAAPAPAPSNWQSGYGGTPQTSPTYSLGATGNTARLGQPVPELLGRHRIFPDFVASPYIRYVDHEQFLHFSLGLSVGEVEIEEERIGDTPIDSFDEIVTEQIGPGEVGDPDIADPRWLVCSDITDSELPDSAAGSPWVGPFIANVTGTEVSRLELDFVAARGLYKFNGSGSFDTKSVDIVIESRPVDDDDNPLGSFSTLDSFTLSGATQQARRVTQTYDVSAGRWEVRVKRTDTKDTAATAGHDVAWTGLRGRLTTERRFGDITVVNVRMKATGDLNGQTSRQYNAIATRKLATWDDEAQAMTTEIAATRSPCDAFAHIARSTNGARLADAQIDLAGLYASKADFADAGWTFDFVFDQTVTLSEALGRVARAVVAERVVQGNQLCLVRDVASEAPVMMFSPRNTRRGSVEIEYKTVDSESADSLAVTYMDSRSWRPVDRVYAFADSPQEKTTSLQLHGVTNREQARAIAWWRLRENRYRRRTVKLGTEMEGLVVQYGDPISFSTDIPQWGQTAEIVEWDETARIATLSEALTWTMGATHYVALRDAKGLLAGPFEATEVEGEAQQVAIGAGDLPEILTGGDRERTFIQFGPGQAYAKRLKAIGVTPKGEHEAELLAIDDDPRMYDALPDDDDDDIDVGTPTDPLDIHVTSSTANLNLRTLANASGYSGLAIQEVTITIDPGVTCYPVVRGTWPADAVPILINQGTIEGVGGNGGDNSGTASMNGQAGGDALDVRSGAIQLDNSDGIIRSGGGGGGGANYYAVQTSQVAYSQFAGGAGGGGQGHPGGAGGAAPFGGTPGSAGSTGAPGAGSDGVTDSGVWFDSGDPPSPHPWSVDAGDGGDGGAWGTAGANGESGYTGDTVIPGGTGGAPGKSINGIANVDWLDADHGSITGPTA